MGSAVSHAKILQVLNALDGPLASTREAILAAHPELLRLRTESTAGVPGSFGPFKLSAAAWFGDELLAYISAFTAAMTRYSLALEAERDPRRERKRVA